MPLFNRRAAYTLMIVSVRFLIVAIIPVLVGTMIGVQRFEGRVLNQILLALMSVVISPVVIAILWSLFVGPLWGRTPSPLQPLPEWMMLSSKSGAQTSLMFVDALITMGIAAVVGGTAFMAVMRGRAIRRSVTLAGVGVWLIGLFLTLASPLHTFDLPYVLTQGGPANSTLTVMLYLYQNAFQRFNFGPAAAVATPLLVLAVVMSIFIWAVITFFRLRLIVVPTSRPTGTSGLLSLLSLPMLILMGLPLVGLMLWGARLVSNNPFVSDSEQAIDTMKLFMNTISGPWLAIWAIQIPAMYLAGMSLGFLKPIHRIVSHILFLVLLLIAFIPAEALMVQWFQMAREARALNTTFIPGFAWLSGTFSLVVFKMFFEGALESFRAMRQTRTVSDAFLRAVFLPSLPIVLLVGAVLSFASVQSLLWPMIVSQQLYTIPLQLLNLRSQFTAGSDKMAELALSFVSTLALIFVPIFALLHIFVLDRLAIVAGPPIDSDLLIMGTEKPKRDADMRGDM